MEFFQKRAHAWWITFVVIGLAILLGARSSLMELRNQAEAVFYEGEDGNNMGINYDLEMISGEAHNMTVVAGRYLDQSHALISQVAEKREALNNAKSPQDKHMAAQELSEAVSSLSDGLETLNLSDTDQAYRQKILTNIQSRNLIIKRSPYNQLASEFNQVLSRFPTNILRLMTFVAPLELYQ